MHSIITFNTLGHMGRFCNQAYQIAGTIGIARRNNMQFAFPRWLNYDHRDRFGSAEDIDLQKYFLNPLPVYEGPNLPARWIEWGFHDVILNGGASLSGHLQSTRYFEHCLDEVRWYFRMVDEPPLSDYVAVHVRLGDYDNAYHPRMGLNYYQPAMALFPGARFLVFSDDLDSCKKIFGNSVEYSEGRSYLDDFKLMKRCRHFIIANSTFSSFAAVLGDAPDKRVVAPRPWFGALAGITGEDIYNPDWTVINYGN